MGTTGVVFDIREFTLHDGPGLRTTVFMKGCPLACSWCHNPEGQSRLPQIIRSPVGERIAGKEYTPDELAGILNKQAQILRSNEGGVTFSGGEPLEQAEFVGEVIERLQDIHIVLDTSGYASESVFRYVAEHVQLVFFDVKIVDRAAHHRHTGRDNTPILRNLISLSTLGIPFVIRVPLVPGLTDTDANLTAIAEMAQGLPNLLRVDLLPYNRAAGAKYTSVGMEFKPDYIEADPVNVNLEPFRKLNIKVTTI
jgi:pyruvate formate lyase activating enzyme